MTNKDGSKYRYLEYFGLKKVFTSPRREMRLMTLIKLEKNRTSFLLVWDPYTKDCYQNNTLNTKQSNYYIQSNYIYMFHTHASLTTFGMRRSQWNCLCFEVSPTNYRGSTGDVFYIIPFKTKTYSRYSNRCCCS